MKILPTLITRLIAFPIVVCLASCGGGGGGGNSVPAVVLDPNMTVPFQTAMANLINNGVNKSYTLSGWVDNSTPSNPVPHTPITGSGNFTIGTPTSGLLTGGPWSGLPTLKSVQVTTGSATGTTTIHYDSAIYTKAAEISSTTTIYYSPYTNPATVKAGDTGSLGSGSESTNLFPSTITSVYSVASDSATSLLVTVTDTLIMYGMSGSDVVKQTVYRITTTGSITLVSITVNKEYGGSVYEVLTFTFA